MKSLREKIAEHVIQDEYDFEYFKANWKNAFFKPNLFYVETRSYRYTSFMFYCVLLHTLSMMSYDLAGFVESLSLDLISGDYGAFLANLAIFAFFVWIIAVAYQYGGGAFFHLRLKWAGAEFLEKTKLESLDIKAKGQAVFSITLLVFAIPVLLLDVLYMLSLFIQLNMFIFLLYIFLICSLFLWERYITYKNVRVVFGISRNMAIVHFVLIPICIPLMLYGTLFYGVFKFFEYVSMLFSGMGG